MKRLLIVLFLCNAAFAVDTKLTALTALASADANDLFYVVDDPTGVPVSRKITRNNLIATWIGSTTITTLGTIATGVWNGTAIPVLYGGTGAASLNDLITLATHTTGNYVATVADGTGIDGTASAEGATYTPTLDLTEIATATFGAGTFTTLIFDAGAIDPTFTMGSNSVAITNAATFTRAGNAISDAATSFAGDVTGTIGATIVGDDSHAHTTTTISGLDVSDDLNLTAGTNITLTGDDLAVDDAFILNTGDIGTGVYDFGGATSFEIPNGAAPTVDATAELAWETDDNDLHIYDSVRDVVIASKNKSRSFVILTPAAGHDFPFWQTPRAITITGVSAICIAGTNVIGQLQEYAGDGTTPVDVDSDWTITTAEYTDIAFTNAAIDAGDWVGWKMTSVSGSVTSFSITYEYYEQ